MLSYKFGPYFLHHILIWSLIFKKKIETGLPKKGNLLNKAVEERGWAWVCTGHHAVVVDWLIICLVSSIFSLLWTRTLSTHVCVSYYFLLYVFGIMVKLVLSSLNWLYFKGCRQWVWSYEWVMIGSVIPVLSECIEANYRLKGFVEKD